VEPFACAQAFDAWMRGNGSFEACLIDVVNRGGDADTTGAIVAAVHGEDQFVARRGYRRAGSGIAHVGEHAGAEVGHDAAVVQAGEQGSA